MLDHPTYIIKTQILQVSHFKIDFNPFLYFKSKCDKKFWNVTDRLGCSTHLTWYLPKNIFKVIFNSLGIQSKYINIL